MREETTMEHNLSLGAHLLAWAFPLALVIIAVADLAISRANREDRP